MQEGLRRPATAFSGGRSGADLRRETTQRITLSTLGANLLGAVLVYLYLQFLAPGALTTTTPSAQFILTAAVYPVHFEVVTPDPMPVPERVLQPPATAGTIDNV